MCQFYNKSDHTADTGCISCQLLPTDILHLQLAFEAMRQSSSQPEAVADAIYQHAMKRSSKDDVCVFVLNFYAETGSATS